LLQFAMISLMTAGLGTEDGQFNASINAVIALVLVLWAAWSIGLLLDQQLRARTELLRQVLIGGSAAAVITLQPGTSQLVPAIVLSMSLVSIALLALLKTPWAPSDENSSDSLQEQVSS
jgi:hypothetical protein